jgi:hypothetical protein
MKAISYLFLFFGLISACAKDPAPTESIPPVTSRLKKVTQTINSGPTPHITVYEYFYRYDGRLDSVDAGASNRYKAVYEDSKLVKMLRYRSDSAVSTAYEEYEYDDLDRPVSRSYWSLDEEAGTFQPLRKYSYTYNAQGKIEKEKYVSYISNLTSTRTYAWENGNLVEEKYFDHNGNLETEYHYGYDSRKNPNRLFDYILVLPGKISKNNLVSWQVTDFTGLTEFYCYSYQISYQYNTANYPVSGQSNCVLSWAYEYVD